MWFNMYKVMEYVVAQILGTLFQVHIQIIAKLEFFLLSKALNTLWVKISHWIINWLAPL